MLTITVLTGSPEHRTEVKRLKSNGLRDFNIVLLPTTLPHRALTLVGTTFLLFELVFIQFFVGEYWFSIELAMFGIPTVLLLMPVAHLWLCWLESKSGCKTFSLIFKGTPPVAYRNWLLLGDDSVSYGLRHVRWDAIDELALTIFGNLQIRSRIVGGAGQEKPDVLLKFPFAVAGKPEQDLFVERVRRHRPEVVLNKRLEKSLAAPQLKGASIGMASGAVVMFVVLLDVGQGSFWYLDLVKHYHLAALEARDGKSQEAERQLKLADDVRAHPFPLSWVAHKFVNQNSAAGILGARADALWLMGRKEEAVSEARAAAEKAEHSTKVKLRLARYLSLTGHRDEARKVLESLIEKHKHTLLPRLYVIAMEKETSRDAAQQLYKQYNQELTTDFFEKEPKWPPGGNLFFHEVIYKDDMDYVIKRLLDMSP